MASQVSNIETRWYSYDLLIHHPVIPVFVYWKSPQRACLSSLTKIQKLLDIIFPICSVAPQDCSITFFTMPMTPGGKIRFYCSVHKILPTLQESNKTCTWLWGCDYIHPILKYVFSITDLSGTYIVLKSRRKHFPRPNQSLYFKKCIPFSSWP